MLSSFLQKIKQHRYLVQIIIGLIICINLLQALFTELFHDEAYYWTWSQHLNWGYYDHPPAISFFIRLGTMLFPNEIGVRFFCIVLNALTIYILYLLTDKKQPLLFLILLLAVPIVHVGGILAVPDSPYIFFVALYLYCYKIFTEKNTWLSSLWLALAVTGMMYSKYHGIMVLFFTILSYPKLLINKKFWGIVAISCTLYAPHLYWAYQHGFDTIIYHLSGRLRLPHSTLAYLAGEIGLAGGIIGLWIFYEAIYFKPTNTFERSLKWICAGIFIFLFIRTISQHVEANWAAAAFLPLLLMAYANLSQKMHLFKRFYAIALPTFALLVVARVLLTWNVFAIKTEFFGWKKWENELKNIAQGCPVVFSDSYQHPSKYMFYAQNQIATSMTSAHYRHNSYDIALYEEQMQGKKVLCMTNQSNCGDIKVLKTPMGHDLYYTFVENFRSFNKVKIAFLTENRRFKVNETANISILMTNGYPYPCHFSENKNFEAHLGATFWQKRAFQWEYFQDFPSSLSNVILSDTLHKDIQVKMPAKPGDYEMTFMIHYGCMYAGYQAPLIKIKVE